MKEMSNRRCRFYKAKRLKEMSFMKKETIKWIVQIIASIATALLTALGTTSCMGYHPTL